MEQDYDKLIEERANEVFEIMVPRVTPEELENIKGAFDFARQAHAPQKRKTGEPYILHPIAVAKIVAHDLELGANPVMAAFLHDVVEDTKYTIKDIKERFGADVARIVRVLTKQKKATYSDSKQVDNFRQMLNSVEYDIRSILIKIADRLHNMRTLSSMPPDKQMKIAGETDYFYAPLANRLGLYNVKTELENLSFRFRCPTDYEEIEDLITEDKKAQGERLKIFTDQIKTTLEEAGIQADVKIEYRTPYSIWRKMQRYGDDFNHLKYRHYTEIVYDTPKGMSEKDMALRIYSVLTNRFKEKPGGFVNYIDSPKENGYQSLHLKLLADFGRWQEVHICSERMVHISEFGSFDDQSSANIKKWIEKFRLTLRDIANQNHDETNFIENVVASFYNDDIMTFTPKGKAVVLPQKATVLDFAYEIHSGLGEKAKYARINGFLSSVKAPLRRGDVVEIFTDPAVHPHPDWLESVVTYKAKKAIRTYLSRQPKEDHTRCEVCNPIPGEEVIGFKESSGKIILHRRDCRDAIRMASQKGDKIRSVEFIPDKTLYPVTVVIKAIDRYHLLVDLVDSITNELHLAIDSIHTSTTDSIVTVEIAFGVHSFMELQSIISHIAAIPAVDEVKYKQRN